MANVGSNVKTFRDEKFVHHQIHNNTSITPVPFPVQDKLSRIEGRLGVVRCSLNQTE